MDGWIDRWTLFTSVLFITSLGFNNQQFTFIKANKNDRLSMGVGDGTNNEDCGSLTGRSGVLWMNALVLAEGSVTI